MTEMARIGRERLPHRRPSITGTFEWIGRPLQITIGFADDRELEVFARAGRPDSDLDAVADDIAVLISLALQHGVPLERIAHSLGRLPDGAPSSVAAMITAAAIKLAKDAAT